MRLWVLLTLIFPSPGFAGTILRFPERSCTSLLREQSFEQYVRERKHSFGQVTFLNTFDAAETWDKYRDYSPSARNPRFGIQQALAQINRPADWLNSGVSFRFFFEDFMGACCFIGQKHPIRRLVLVDEWEPQRFVELLFARTSWSLIQEQVEFEITPHLAQLKLPRPTVEPYLLRSPLRALYRYKTQIEYATAHSAAETVGEHSIDLISDYGGEFFFKNAGEVLASYHSQLRVGGFLFLAIPVAKLHASESLVRFSVQDRHRQFYGIEGDEFFARIPGFEMINAYDVQGPIGVDFPTGPQHAAVNLKNPHYGQYHVLVVVLRKAHHIPAAVRESLIQSESRHYRLAPLQVPR